MNLRPTRDRSLPSPLPPGQGIPHGGRHRRNQTPLRNNGKTLLDVPAGGAQHSTVAGLAALAFAPKADGFVTADAAGRLSHFRLDNPHPEVTWRSLFGKVWYEGYEKPEYVWQSTGGTDDFEPKLSLTPLIYGTLKGTFYALLFAVPLAIPAYLCCAKAAL